MTVNFIRHGETEGNRQKKYIGRTDESLCSRGEEYLKSVKYPPCDIVFSSPLKRCIQTAEIIYPNKKPVICPDFRECDFGDFEGMNFKELSNNADYISWIESGGRNTFPDGENPQQFKERCVAEFIEIMKLTDENMTVSLVVHGGTVMALMERFCTPQRDYYDFQVKNGHGYITEYKDGKIEIISKI